MTPISRQRLPKAKLVYCPASTGRRTAASLCRAYHSGKSLARRTPAEALTGSGVECKGGGLKVVGTMHTQICALREVLSQQTVCVLVGAALPWALGIAEVDMQPCVDAQARVLAHLCALVPRQRLTELLGEGSHSARDRIADRLCSVARGSGPVLHTRP